MNITKRIRPSQYEIHLYFNNKKPSFLDKNDGYDTYDRPT